MRFKDYLLRENTIYGNHDDDVDMIVDMIQNDCYDILEIYQNTGIPVWRGDRDESGTTGTFKKEIHQDRKPVQMPTNFHQWLKDAFDILKLPANRSNSIFCTCDEGIAIDWGNPFIVFPRDGFDCVAFEKYPEGDNETYAFTKLRSICRRAQQLVGEGKIKKGDEPQWVANAIKISMPPTKTTTVTAAEKLIKRKPDDFLIHSPWWIGVNPYTPVGVKILKALELGHAFTSKG